jgi:hypothetical protein
MAAPLESKDGALQLDQSLHKKEGENTDGDESIKKSLYKAFEQFHKNHSDLQSQICGVSPLYSY